MDTAAWRRTENETAVASLVHEYGELGFSD